MSAIFQYDTNVFRHFVKDNFHRVRNYLNDGIYDRLDCGELDKWQGFNFSYNNKTNEADVRNGQVFTNSSKELNIKCLDGKIIKIEVEESDDLNNGRETTIQKIHYVDQDKNCIYGKRSKYTNDDGEIFYKYYFPYCSLKFEAKDSDIWDSFFTFFKIAAITGLDDKAATAASDLQNAACVISGMPAESLRFIVSLGDQYLRYIFSAFGIESDVTPHYGNEVTQNDRIKYLSKLILDKGNKKHFCFKIQDLMHLNRALRNNEGHYQMDLDNPEEMIRRFMLDHVMLIYMLKHVLGLKLTNAYESVDIEKNLYVPASIEEGLKISGNDVLKGEDKAAAYIKPFTMFEVSGDSNTSEKEFSIINPNCAKAQFRKGSGGVQSKYVELPLIEKIDYKTLFESINSQLATLRAESVTKQELKKVLQKIEEERRKFYKKEKDKFEQELSKLEESHSELIAEQRDSKNKLKNTIAALNTTQAGVKKIKIGVILLWCILGILIAAGSILCIMANTRDWAVKYAPFYRMSQTYFNFSHDKGDISYDRGMYIDKIISDSLSNATLFNDSLLLVSLNPLRDKAHEAYRNAASAYIDMLASKKCDDTEHAAYRLALMSLSGKGIEYSEEKAAEYASMTNSEHTRGLRALTEYYATGDLSLLRKDIPLLRKAGADDHFASLAVIRYEYELSNQSASPGLEQEKKAELIQKKVKLIQDCLDLWKLQNDASATAGLMGAAIPLDDKIIRDIPLSVGILFDMSCHNIPVAQICLGDIFDKLRNTTLAIPQLLAAFHNGSDYSGVQALLLLRRNATIDEEIFSKYPELGRVRWKINLLTEMESIPKNLTNISEEEHAAAYDRLRYLESKVSGTNLFIRKSKNWKDVFTMTNPDSAAHFISHIDSLQLRPDIARISDEMLGAVKDYISAIYYFEGYTILKDMAIMSKTQYAATHCWQAQHQKDFLTPCSPKP